MEALIWSLIGTAIGGATWLTYTHTSKMRKVHYVALALTVCVGLFLIYIQGVIEDNYSKAVLEIRLVNINLGKNENDLLRVAETAVLAKQVESLSTNQTRMIICACVVILFGIFIGLSFLFKYLKDDKKIKEKKEPPNPPIAQE